VCLMRIISWNIRGLGGLVKRNEVQKLVREKNPSIVCLQATKLPICDDFFCSSLWANVPHAFSFRPSVGASGGLLTIWDTTEVEVWSSVSRDHVLWCHGRFLSSGEEFHVANVYGPCDAGAKQGLWDSLSLRLQSLGGKQVCVCGDFNAVRFLEERRSIKIDSHPLDHIRLAAL
jgi:exonuclease III